MGQNVKLSAWLDAAKSDARGQDEFGRRRATPNDPKLSDGGVRRGTCMVGGKAAVEAGAVTHGAVRFSAWLGVAVIADYLAPTPWHQ